MFRPVLTSKDLGGRPPLASRCISLSWLFFHSDDIEGGSAGPNCGRNHAERRSMCAGPVHVQLRLATPSAAGHQIVCDLEECWAALEWQVRPKPRLALSRVKG